MRTSRHAVLTGSHLRELVTLELSCRRSYAVQRLERNGHDFRRITEIREAESGEIVQMCPIMSVDLESIMQDEIWGDLVAGGRA
jgi:hypothetical protein